VNERATDQDLLLQTNSLCYMFGRSTTAVSICPPAYYADILCERGRCYIYEVYSGDSSTHTSDKEKTKATRAETWKKAMEGWGTGVHPNLKDTMFYI
jgi:eukaryotic translation initiation factor 2C